MRLRVKHSSTYLYPTPASDSYNECRLMPLSDADQTCLDFRLITDPAARVFAYDLPTGRVHHFDVRSPHARLSVVAQSLVTTYKHDPFVGLQLEEPDMEYYTRAGVSQRYAEYLAPTQRVQFHPDVERIASVARRQADGRTAPFLINLTRLLHRAVAFQPGATTVESTVDNVLEARQGVCQDFTHLMLAVCRSQGIPARYVSGYLCTVRTDPKCYASEALETDVSQIDGGDEELVGGDAMHAWAECLMPDERWHGFDPTNNLLANDLHVKVHFGRDYGDVSPIRGVFRGPFAHKLDVQVTVERERA